MTEYVSVKLVFGKIVLAGFLSESMNSICSVILVQLNVCFEGSFSHLPKEPCNKRDVFPITQRHR